MCTVSAIHDYGRRMPNDWWNRGRFDDWQKLVEHAKDFDRKTGQEDCEDPEKLKFIQRIEERLKKIERLVAEAETPPAAADENGRVSLFLLGSSILPSTFLFSGKTIQLGDVVRQAFTDSELTIGEWNSLDEVERDKLLVAAATLIKGKIAAETERAESKAKRK